MPQRTPHVSGLDAGCHEVGAGGDLVVVSFAEAVVTAALSVNTRGNRGGMRFEGNCISILVPEKKSGTP